MHTIQQKMTTSCYTHKQNHTHMHTEYFICEIHPLLVLITFLALGKQAAISNEMCNFQTHLNDWCLQAFSLKFSSGECQRTSLIGWGNSLMSLGNNERGWPMSMLTYGTTKCQWVPAWDLTPGPRCVLQTEIHWIIHLEMEAPATR